MILRAFRVILRSLRGRIVAGALLWSIGLFVLLNHVVYKVAAAILPRGSTGLTVLFVLTGMLFVLTGLLLVASALRKVDSVRASVASLHSGEGRRLESGNLAEIEPLVHDMNALLDHRERVVRRAIATAGDLAHGLKTPLAIVAQEAERLEATSQNESAAIIAEQVERMRREVDVHLARARTSGSGAPYGAQVKVRPIAERLVRTIGRLYAAKAIDFAIDIPASCAVRCETEDLQEMLGNLLENACKWAHTSVILSSASPESKDLLPSHNGVTIVVDDDGPGIDEAMRERVLQRGVRADETGSGSGLGLAIVTDLVDLYGGSLILETAPREGLRVKLTLPAATA